MSHQPAIGLGKARHPALSDGWLSELARDERIARPITDEMQRDVRRWFRRRAPVILRRHAFESWLSTLDVPVSLVQRLAEAMQKVGGAIVARGEEFTELPLKHIPVRIEAITPRAMADWESLASADAVEWELGNWDRSASDASDPSSLASLVMAWPIDIPDHHRFAIKVALLQSMAGASVPVGMVIPASEPSLDRLFKLIDLSHVGVDYLVLRHPASCLEPNHPAKDYFAFDPIELVRQARHTLDRLGFLGIALVVDYPWEDGYQAAQAMMAGASSVCCDRHVVRCLSDDFTREGSIDESLTSRWLGGSPATSHPSPVLNFLLKNEVMDRVILRFVDQFRAGLDFGGTVDF